MQKVQIEHRFAEGVVAQMLQRAGSQFTVLEGSADIGCDIFIRDGNSLHAIEVKYAKNPLDAKQVLRKWQKVVESGSSKDARKSKRAVPAEIHLVVVTGGGEQIFADSDVIPYLSPDSHTKISEIKPGEPLK